MKAINNIQALRLTCSDINYFPTTTSFVDKPINRLYAFIDGYPYDFDRKRLFNRKFAGDYAVTLKDKNDNNIMKNVDLLLFASNEYPDLLDLQGKCLSWQNSYIKGFGLSSGCDRILLYVFYDGYREIREQYDVIKTIRMPKLEEERKLSDFIDGYYGLLKRIDVRMLTTDETNAFLTLNCRSGRTYNNVHLGAFSENKYVTEMFSCYPRFLNPLYIADFDVVFNNSFITNSSDNLELTLYFGRV